MTPHPSGGSNLASYIAYIFGPLGPREESMDIFWKYMLVRKHQYQEKVWVYEYFTL